MSDELKLNLGNAWQTLGADCSTVSKLPDDERASLFAAFVRSCETDPEIKVRVEENAEVDTTIGTSAPLFVGKTVYVSMSRVARDTIANSISLLASLVLLGQLNLLSFSVSLSVDVLVACCRNFCRLTDSERALLQALCDVILEQDLPDYAPSTTEIAESANIPAADAAELLRSLSERPVAPVKGDDDNGWYLEI